MGKGRSKVWRNTTQQRCESWPQQGLAPCSRASQSRALGSSKLYREEKLEWVSVVWGSWGCPMLQPTAPTAGLGLLICREECCRSEGSLPRA